jgi:hypothetical protein
MIFLEAASFGKEGDSGITRAQKFKRVYARVQLKLTDFRLAPGLDIFVVPGSWFRANHARAWC